MTELVVHLPEAHGVAPAVSCDQIRHDSSGIVEVHVRVERVLSATAEAGDGAPEEVPHAHLAVPAAVERDRVEGRREVEGGVGRAAREGEQSARLGLTLGNAEGATPPVVEVVAVSAKSLGAEAGLVAGDVVLAVNGREVTKHEEAKKLIDESGLEVHSAILLQEAADKVAAVLACNTEVF